MSGSRGGVGGTVCDFRRKVPNSTNDTGHKALMPGVKLAAALLAC